MKKLLLTATIAAFGFVTTANAQDLSIGVKAGANFANISAEGVSLSSRTALHAGVVLEIGLQEKFSIQPELIYSQQGTDIAGLAKISLDYLSLPVLAKYYVAEGFSLEAGPQFSYLVSDKAEAFGQTSSGDFDGNKFDFAGAVGLGYKTKMGIFAQARYVLGFTGINDLDSSDTSIKNKVFQLSIGYSF